MKVWSLLDNVNLRETVKQTDFAIQNDRVKKDGIVRKFEERFSGEVNMPIQHPAMAVDNKNAQSVHKPVGQMSLLDRELLLLAYKNAIEENKNVRSEGRRSLLKSDQRMENEIAVLKEKDAQLFRILQNWARRFQLEKMFHDLGIKKLDDFKRIMHQFNVKIDERALLQRNLFAKQRGADEHSILRAYQHSKVIENKEELVRLREDLSDKLFISLEDAKKQLDDVNAKKFILQVQALQEQTKDQIEAAMDFGVNADGSKKSA